MRNVDETVAVSGGFDCLHRGHVRMIQEASQFGEVVIILNSDAWLMRKKGYVFMPWEERKEILEAIKGVKKVVPVDDTDGTVCEALGREKPTYFANGGDRSDKNTPELTVCKDNNITMIWGIGGGKIQSSSELVSRLRKVS